jgi:O-antigen/teichoic acid export membrane protein
MEIVKVMIYFQNIVFRISIFSLFFIGFIFILDLKYFVLAYLTGTIITLIISSIYAKIKLKAKLVRKKFENVTKEILVFSAPLWTITLLSIIVMNVSILSLGFFRNPESVASFRIGHALAHYIAMILGSVGFLFTPIVSYFFAQKKYNEIKEVYVTITKWVFLISFPLFLIFFLFPSETITIVYTAKYTDASFTLQLVGISFIVHTFLGPNMNTLVAYGDTKILAYIYVIQTIICIILAITLIPIYGLSGAALTFFLSLSIINILTSIVLYNKYKIHPFKKHYLLPAILTLLLVAFIYFIYSTFLPHFLFAPVLFFPIFLLIYILMSVITKSITDIDKVIIKAILGKLRKTSQL